MSVVAQDNFFATAPEDDNAVAQWNMHSGERLGTLVNVLTDALVACSLQQLRHAQHQVPLLGIALESMQSSPRTSGWSLGLEMDMPKSGFSA